MTESLDCVVIGAGVIGLAIARSLGMAGRDVVILEATTAIGTGASSRNSEVIHAGLYNPAESLKTRLCIEGRDKLYQYCQTHLVDHKRIGKIIVGTNENQCTKLQQLQAAATTNGAGELSWLDRAAITSLEPNVDGQFGLFSPLTGIIDCHAYMLSLLGNIEAKGGTVAFGSGVVGGACQQNGIMLEVGGASPVRVKARTVINAAGIGAQGIAASLTGFPQAHIPRQSLARGHYYTLVGKSPFRHLVYPLPEPGGLGIHVTLDLAGQTRFGPDVRWCDEDDVSFDDCRRADFIAAIKQYYPALEEDRLCPGDVGVRSKVAGPDDGFGDFVISGPLDHTIPGLVNLFGIESPGLTASLAIADHVAELLA